MTAWPTIVVNSIKTGCLTTATTTLATAVCGQAELGNPVAPVNAISHIVWGEKAARRDALSAKYTLTGWALHAAAMIGWAGVSELLASRTKVYQPAAALAQGAAVSGVAYVTDYFVVPRRFTPGFEKRLSGASLLAIYSVLAVSLAAGRGWASD